MFPRINSHKVFPGDQSQIQLKTSTKIPQSLVQLGNQQLNYEEIDVNRIPQEIYNAPYNPEMTSPQKQTMSTPEKFLINDQIAVNPPTYDPEPIYQSSTCSQTLKTKKWCILGVSLSVVAVIVAAIVVGVVLTGKKPDTSEASGDVPIQEFTCDQSPSECAGVPQQVSSYIFTNYNHPDEVRSLLQTSRSFNLISYNTSLNFTRQNLTDAFRNISRSAQCMSFNLPNSFDETFHKLSELQFTTSLQIEMYFKMTESFSGQPLKLSNNANLAQTCRFQITDSRRRLLQQSPNVGENTTSDCISNATSVLVYFSGLGYSPSSAIQDVRRMQEILSNSSTNFDAGIIVVGAWRSDTRLGYLREIAQSYYLTVLGHTSTYQSRLSWSCALRMILNRCRDYSYLPLLMTSDNFLNFYRFYLQQTIWSFINQESYFEIGRHRDFVTQQIGEGKKVVMMAHAEGTLYANKVYDTLNSTQKQYVSLVYIAPTVDKMADNSTNYITNPNDTVISVLRTRAQFNNYIPVPLPANMPAATFESESSLNSNHQLPGYALAYKDNLTQLIVSAKARAVQPPRSMGSGPITITLTWDSQKDVDLHVLEPSGIHVYYGYKTGVSGYLDLDDINSYGPQHYYTKCDPIPGNYTIYLQFFDGNRASTTITTVSAGTEYFMKSITFTPGQQKSVCIINVQYNTATSSYQFTIYPA